MKKVLIILVILTAPFLASAQDNTTSTVVDETITITAPVKEDVKTEASKSTAASFRAKAKDMNYKKSNDIISVKAYRKSLQIKVKEIKLC